MRLNKVIYTPIEFLAKALRAHLLSTERTSVYMWRVLWHLQYLAIRAGTPIVCQETGHELPEEYRKLILCAMRAYRHNWKPRRLLGKG